MNENKKTPLPITERDMEAAAHVLRTWLTSEEALNIPDYMFKEAVAEVLDKALASTEFSVPDQFLRHDRRLWKTSNGKTREYLESL